MSCGIKEVELMIQKERPHKKFKSRLGQKRQVLIKKANRSEKFLIPHFYNVTFSRYQDGRSKNQFYIGFIIDYSPNILIVECIYEYSC